MNGVRPFLEKDKPKFKIDKNYNVRSIEEIIRKRVDFLNAEQIIFIIECLFRSDVIEERREICFVRTFVDFNSFNKILILIHFFCREYSKYTL